MPCDRLAETAMRWRKDTNAVVYEPRWGCRIRFGAVLDRVRFGTFRCRRRDVRGKGATLAT